MNVMFQYLKIPYGENLLTMLGSDCIEMYEHSQEGENDDTKHFHNLMEIGICRTGSGEVLIDDKRYHYKQNDVIVIPRNFAHAIIPAEKSFWEYIYLKPGTFIEKVEGMDSRKKASLVENVEARAFTKSKDESTTLFAEVNLIMDQYRRREYEYKKSVGGLIFALFIEIARINRKESQKPEFERALNSEKVEALGAALEYIEANYAKDLRTIDIAKASFVSETYLRRLFMESCATSPKHYAKMIRIEKACEMLENKNVNITEVAYKVGYTNISTFISNFKQVTGKTPKQWKENKMQNRI